MPGPPGTSLDTASGAARRGRKAPRPCKAHEVDHVWMRRYGTVRMEPDAVPCRTCGWSRYTHVVAALAPKDTAKRRRRYGAGKRKKRQANRPAKSTTRHAAD